MLLEAGVTVTAGVVVVDAVTVTEAVPEALLYVAESALSGVYLAVNVSEPVASDPAGIAMDAEPELSAVAVEVYVPLERTTEPVGVAPVPATATVTLRLCAVVMLLEAGVTVTVGVMGF
jgi:hypothetical protein